MCRECPLTRCDFRCPEAPDPPSVFVCSGCGESIYEGEDYWDILGEQWCESCIDKAKGVAVYDPC